MVETIHKFSIFPFGLDLTFGGLAFVFEFWFSASEGGNQLRGGAVDRAQPLITHLP